MEPRLGNGKRLRKNDWEWEWRFKKWEHLESICTEWIWTGKKAEKYTENKSTEKLKALSLNDHGWDIIEGKQNSTGGTLIKC